MAHVVLLTATIQPKADQPGLVLSKAEDRIKDYDAALAFYSRLLDDGVLDAILFVDNSGYDLSTLKAAHPSPKIEWISFHGLDYPNTYHRGYGEFKLVEYAMHNSRMLERFSEHDTIWKVTGRYIVRNLKMCTRAAPKGLGLYCTVKGNWAEMSVMAWSKAGYKRYLDGVYNLFALNTAPELKLAGLITERRAQQPDPSLFVRMNWQPLIEGRRGSDGTRFLGRFTLLKFYGTSVGNLGRLLLNSLFSKPARENK